MDNRWINNSLKKQYFKNIQSGPYSIDQSVRSYLLLSLKCVAGPSWAMLFPATLYKGPSDCPLCCASRQRRGMRQASLWENWCLTVNAVALIFQRLTEILLDYLSSYKKIFKIKNEIPLTNLWVADCVDKKGEPQTSARKSFLLGWPMVNFVATFCSSEVKEQWRSSLQRYITLAVEKDHSKSIPLQISTKDCKKSSYSVTVTISNSDTANDIIHKALSMLGITFLTSHMFLP
ncbi:rho GTPase-activating protein 20-like isoform X2 [Carlito syrichta]|uniref:Rho GTPase-activating protein 20-like isoform X2 n=1 Tax=Carlito syrichta TaxID=1868482 RepID=A0A1U7UMQ7_CARSF|nr:rho GTPase-activating protein 20-like isoform X2 [Carlito syrichta]